MLAVGEGIAMGIDGVGIAWEPYLTFVRGVLDFHGNSGNAIEHRICQAEKTYHRWKPLITSRWGFTEAPSGARGSCSDILTPMAVGDLDTS